MKLASKRETNDKIYFQIIVLKQFCLDKVTARRQSFRCFLLVIFALAMSDKLLFVVVFGLLKAEREVLPFPKLMEILRQKKELSTFTSVKIF